MEYVIPVAAFSDSVYTVEVSAALLGILSQSDVGVVTSLQSIAIDSILNNGRLLLAAAQSYPQHIIKKLFSVAFQNSHQAAIELLIFHWPMPTFCLKEIIPSITCSLDCIPDFLYYRYSYIQDALLKIEASLKPVKCLFWDLSLTSFRADDYGESAYYEDKYGDTPFALLFQGRNHNNRSLDTENESEDLKNQPPLTFVSNLNCDRYKKHLLYHKKSKHGKANPWFGHQHFELAYFKVFNSTSSDWTKRYCVGCRSCIYSESLVLDFSASFYVNNGRIMMDLRNAFDLLTWRSCLVETLVIDLHTVETPSVAKDTEKILTLANCIQSFSNLLFLTVICPDLHKLSLLPTASASLSSLNDSFFFDSQLKTLQELELAMSNVNVDQLCLYMSVNHFNNLKSFPNVMRCLVSLYLTGCSQFSELLNISQEVFLPKLKQISIQCVHDENATDDLLSLFELYVTRSPCLEVFICSWIDYIPDTYDPGTYVTYLRSLRHPTLKVFAYSLPFPPKRKDFLYNSIFRRSPMPLGQGLAVGQGHQNVVNTMSSPCGSHLNLVRL